MNVCLLIDLDIFPKKVGNIQPEPCCSTVNQTVSAKTHVNSESQGENPSKPRNWTNISPDSYPDTRFKMMTKGLTPKKSFVYPIIFGTPHLIPNLISDQRLDKVRATLKVCSPQQQFNH